METMGGQINAFTGRELTALHGVVPAAQLTPLLHLFRDMLRAPRFNDDDVAVERGVVLQEMAHIDDSPAEAVEDFAVAQVWKDHPIGWPVLGNPIDLAQTHAQVVRDYLAATLRRAPLTIVACGGVDHERLVSECVGLAEIDVATAQPEAAPRFVAKQQRKTKRLAQTQLLWVLPAPALRDTAYIAAALINHVLGGGTSSRLFQDIRERRGLVYDVHSRLDLYSDCGLWFVATSCEPQQAAPCRAAIESVIEELCAHGPSDNELEQARAHIEARLLIEADDPESEMERIARDLIYRGRVIEVDERLRELRSVTAAQARECLAHAWQQRAIFEWGPRGKS
jgi:predicted Zn-dependent peptidase